MIEVLIGITFLAAILGSILGAYTIIQKWVKDGIAMASSGATASTLVEEMVRPVIREGRIFSIYPGGDTLTVIGYDSSQTVFTYSDNTIKKNGNTIAENVAKIPELDIFQQVEANERVGINFAISTQGVIGSYKEVRISTGIKLRN